MSDARILIYDIENTPSLGWAWQKYDTTINEFERDWWMLCFAYKWLGEKTVKTVAQPDFPRYAKDKTDDFEVVSALWHLFDEADMVVAHNGNRFDQAKSRARFLVHGFDPPSPFKEVDTLQVARRNFNFTANNLDELCRQLGIGRKEYDGGFSTWLGCMNGDPAAWKRMLRYNKRDVQMLEELYLRLRPWIPNPPNLATLTAEENACPKCGEKGRMIKRGYAVANVQTYYRLRCSACGGYSRSRLPIKDHPKPAAVG